MPPAATEDVVKMEKDVCSHRFAFLLNNFIRRLLQNPEKTVGEYITPGDTIIDIGCGPGFFSVEMAKMTGDSGKVYAVDLQKEMLEITRNKANKYNLENRMIFHQCTENSIGLPDDVKADFILAFYMVHETPDQIQFFQNIKTLLKKEGRCLIVEPPFHVSKKQFARMRSDIQDAGFIILDTPAKKGGNSLLITH